MDQFGARTVVGGKVGRNSNGGKRRLVGRSKGFEVNSFVDGASIRRRLGTLKCNKATLESKLARKRDRLRTFCVFRCNPCPVLQSTFPDLLPLGRFDCSVVHVGIEPLARLRFSPGRLHHASPSYRLSCGTLLPPPFFPPRSPIHAFGLVTSPAPTPCPSSLGPPARPSPLAPYRPPSVPGSHRPSVASLRPNPAPAHGFPP